MQHANVIHGMKGKYVGGWMSGKIVECVGGWILGRRDGLRVQESSNFFGSTLVLKY